MYVEIKQLSVEEDWDKGIYSFTGELHIDGKLTARISQASMGATTLVDPVDIEQRIKLNEFRKWVDQLPPLYYHPDTKGRRTIRFDRNLADYVAGLVQGVQKITESPTHHRKMYEDMQTHIIIGNPTENAYKTFGKENESTALFFKVLMPSIRTQVARIVQEKLLPTLGKTDYILNNNLSIDELMKLGIPRDKILPAPVYHFEPIVKQKKQLPAKQNQGKRKK